jgi:hypothetical protein
VIEEEPDKNEGSDQGMEMVGEEEEEPEDNDGEDEMDIETG